MSNLNEQLELQQQINDVLRERQSMMSRGASELSNQVRMAENLRDALKDARPPRNAAEECREMADCLDQASDRADRLGDRMRAAGDAVGGVNKVFGNLAKAGLGIAGITSIFQKVLGMAQGLIGALTSVVQGIFDIGLAIVSIPFKVFGALIEMAGQGGGGDSGLRQVIQDVRKEFGNLATNESKMVLKGFENLKKGANNLAGSGRTVRQLYGRGRKGLVEAYKDHLELTKALGPSYSKLSGDIAKYSAELAVMRKGLGMTNEQQAHMVKHAKAMGHDIKQYQENLTKIANSLGTEFQVNAKGIGKNMAAMTDKIETFGHLGEAALGEVAVAAIKTGTAIDDLASLLEKTLDFEATAEGAALLSSALGMNTDTMKLMKAESPTEIQEEYRRAFLATGKSLKDLNLAQRSILMQGTGMNAQMMETTFGYRDQELGLKNVKDASQKAAKEQKTQIQVLSEIAKGIEKIIQQGGSKKFKGFWDAFQQGFSRGVRRSKPFLKMFWNIRKSLKATYRMGRSVGKMFVDMFPGVKQMFGGMAKIFDPKRFKRTLLEPIKKAFKSFFGDLTGNDPKASVRTFLDKLKNIFTNWFKASGSGGGEIWEGFKKFMTGIKHILVGLIPYVMEGLTDLFNSITKWVQSPSSPETMKMWNAFVSMWSSFFSEIWSAIEPALNPLWEAAGTMMDTLWTAISNWFSANSDKFAEIGNQIWCGLLSIPGFETALSALKIYMAINLAVTFAQVAASVIAGISGIAGLIGGLMGPGGPPPGGQGGIAGTIAAFQDLNPADFFRAVGVALAIGVFLGAIMLTIGLSLILIEKMGGISVESAIGMGIAVTALVIAAGAAAGATALIMKMIPTPEWPKVIAGVAMMGVFMVILSLGFALGLWAMKGALEGIDPMGMAAVLTALVSILTAMIPLLPIALAIGVALTSGWGALGVAALAIGMAAVGGLMVLLVHCIIPALQLLSKADFGDMNTMAKKVEMLVQVIEALHPLVEVQTVIMQLEDLDADLMLKLMEKQEKAIVGIVTSLGGLVKGIVTQLKGMAPEDILAASAVGGALGGVGNLIKAITGPMMTLSKQVIDESNAWVWEDVDSITGLWCAMTPSIILLVEGLGGPIKTMVEAILTIKIASKNQIENAKAKVGLVSAAVAGVGGIVDAIEKLMKILPKQGRLGKVIEVTEKRHAHSKKETTFTRRQTKQEMFLASMEDAAVMFSFFAGEFGTQLKILVSSILGIPELSGDPKVLKPKLEVITQAFGILSMFGETMGSFGPWLDRASGIFKGVADEQVTINDVTQIVGPTATQLMDTLKTVFTGMATLIKTSLPAVIGAVEELLRNPTVIKMSANRRRYKRRMEVITGAFEALGAMVSAMSGLSKLGEVEPGKPIITEAELKNPTVITVQKLLMGGKRSPLGKHLAMLKEMEPVMEEGIKIVQRLTGKIKDPRALKKKLGGLTAVADFLIKIPSVLGSITDVTKAMEKGDTSAMGGVFGATAEGGAGSFKAMIATIASFMAWDGKTGHQLVGSMSIPEFAHRIATTQWAKLDRPTRRLDNVRKFLDSTKLGFEQIAMAMPSPTELAAITNLDLLGSILSEKVREKIGTIEGSGPISLSKLTELLAATKFHDVGDEAKDIGSLTTLMNHYMQLAPAILDAQAFSHSGVPEALGSIVQEINLINQAAQSIMEGVRINVAMDKVSKAIAWKGDKKVKLVEGKFEMKLEVRVQMGKDEMIGYLTGKTKTQVKKAGGFLNLPSGE